MTLQQLEYIVRLDNHRHFVTAAEQCFVTQPTLTMQLKKLEEEMGVKIFDRTKKPLRPTKAGEQIILKARQILREVSQLKEFVASEKESLQGEFRLGVIPTLAPYLLPMFLPRFVRENPGTRLKIREMQTADIVRGLKNDTLDIGLLVAPLEEQEIREVSLFNEPFLLYLPPRHELRSQQKISAEKLDPSQLLVLDEGHCFRSQTLKICNPNSTGGTSGFDYQSGSIEVLKKMVRQGMGYTLIPELSVTETDKDFVRRFTSPEPVREVSLAVHNSFTRELLIDHLRTHLLSVIPDSFNKSRPHIRVKWH